LDGDLKIGVGDLCCLINGMHQQPPAEPAKGDFNEDGRIDSEDLFLLAGQWGKLIPTGCKNLNEEDSK